MLLVGDSLYAVLMYQFREATNLAHSFPYVEKCAYLMALHLLMQFDFASLRQLKNLTVRNVFLL